MSEPTQTTCSRRALLKASAGATAAAAASGTAVAQDAPYDGYLSDANLYDGTTVDLTGQSEVTIEVGAGNGLAFDPPAVQVDPGTTVTWEWTGAGGNHNVVADDESFRSGDPVGEAGTTFEQTFEEAGAVKYFCEPHGEVGMRGVVAVGDTAEGDVAAPETGGEGGSGGEGGEGGGGSGTAANQLALGTLLAMLVMGLLSPVVFLLLARRRMGESRPPS